MHQIFFGIHGRRARRVVLSERHTFTRLIRKSKLATTRDQGELLKGFTFVFTGRLTRWSRKKAARAAESLGAAVTSDVSEATDYLVVGSKPGSKLAKARNIGVNVVNECQFAKILNGEVAPKSDRREARALARQRAIQDEGFDIPINDGDITDLNRQGLKALCQCGRELKRIMKRGNEHAWVCDRDHAACKLRRYALHRIGYQRTDR